MQEVNSKKVSSKKVGTKKVGVKKVRARLTIDNIITVLKYLEEYEQEEQDWKEEMEDAETLAEASKIIKLHSMKYDPDYIIVQLLTKNKIDITPAELKKLWSLIK